MNIWRTVYAVVAPGGPAEDDCGAVVWRGQWHHPACSKARVCDWRTTVCVSTCNVRPHKVGRKQAEVQIAGHYLGSTQVPVECRRNSGHSCAERQGCTHGGDIQDVQPVLHAGTERQDHVQHTGQVCMQLSCCAGSKARTGPAGVQEGRPLGQIVGTGSQQVARPPLAVRKWHENK